MKVTKIFDMRRMRVDLVLAIIVTLFFAMAGRAAAVPETTGVRITDVTTSSFSVVWMTDMPTDPSVEVYADSSMSVRLTDKLAIAAMPAGSSEVAQAAKGKGIMKVRVSGLSAATRYYAKTVTRDPMNPSSAGYSPLYEVVTASKVVPYRAMGTELQELSNDLSAFSVYVRPSGAGSKPGIGDIIIFDIEGSPYPLSVFAGDWISAPEGILDLNNLFDANGVSLEIAGGERIVITVYRGIALSALTHYRKSPLKSAMVNVANPLRGFFADINLDGRVDNGDFAEFRKHYRTIKDDAFYNPDYDFVEDPEGKVDARDFSRFSREYGRTNVQ